MQSIALADVGAFAYYARVRVIDLGGLTDKTIAHSPGKLVDKHIDPGYVLEHHPELILLHSAGPARTDRSATKRLARAGAGAIGVNAPGRVSRAEP